MHHQTGLSPTSRLEQCWEVPGHSTSGVPIGKASQAAHPLRGWDFKGCDSGSPFIIPGQTQTDIIITLWPNCKLGFTLMLFVLLCKMWNVVKPGAWLARPLLGAQQSQDSPILSMVLQILHSQQAGRQSQSLPVKTVSRQVRHKVRGLLCFASEA